MTALESQAPAASAAVPSPAIAPEPQARSAEALSPAAPSDTPSKTPTISVSPKAVDAIAKQMKKRGTLDASLRLGIRGGGCSGFSYVIEFHDGAPRSRDRVFEHVASDGTAVRVVVDPKSLVYLQGTLLDWEQTLMRQGFKFVNPNEKAGCGCGTSFSV